MTDTPMNPFDGEIRQVGQTLHGAGLIGQDLLDIERDYPAREARSFTPDEIAGMIDHTCLQPGATQADIALLCAEALENRFAAVCVNPVHVAQCARMLEGSPVAVATVAGFPLGATLSSIKAEEARACVDLGADEVDMVVNIGMIRDSQWAAALDDIRAVVDASAGRLVKVILETCWLTGEEIIAACLLSRAAGAGFVKTSTGFGSAGATEHHVRLMRRVVGGSMGVKAAGGIRTAEDARHLLAAGASRLGASASIDLIQPIG